MKWKPAPIKDLIKVFKSGKLPVISLNPSYISGGSLLWKRLDAVCLSKLARKACVSTSVYVCVCVCTNSCHVCCVFTDSFTRMFHQHVYSCAVPTVEPWNAEAAIRRAVQGVSGLGTWILLCRIQEPSDLTPRGP